MASQYNSPWGLVSVDIHEVPETTSIYKLEIQLENSERLYTSFDPIEIFVINPNTSDRMMIKFHPKEIARGKKKAPLYMCGSIENYTGLFEVKLRLTRGDSTDYGTVEVAGELD